jgi:hypothetical protein
MLLLKVEESSLILTRELDSGGKPNLLKRRPSVELEFSIEKIAVVIDLMEQSSRLETKNVEEFQMVAR